MGPARGGRVTGLALYLPLAVVGDCWLLGTGRVSIAVALVATEIGGSYHLWAAFAHRARAQSRAEAP